MAATSQRTIKRRPAHCAEGSRKAPKGAKGAHFLTHTLRHSLRSLRALVNEIFIALAPNRLTVYIRPAYSGLVPDKDGTRIGVLQLQGAKPSIIDGFFYAQRIGFSPMEGRVRGQQCPLVTCGQHANLARSSTPIGVGMVDFQINHKEAHMPSTNSPVQSHSEQICRLAGIADTIGAMLSVFAMLPPAGQDDAIAVSASLADDLAQQLAAIVGGAA